MMESTHAQAQISRSAPNDLDPYNVKEYTLDNGLKVFISVNRQMPRVQTMIAVKAGSKFDPPATTGLAHYLEHMMFKGTHRYGTTDWNKEKALLDQIAALYEKHLSESDPAKKAAIYADIDRLSFEASKFAVPSEYDKMVASLGASGTNAFTSNDMTVYVNDIPSAAIDKWAHLEAERFSTLVLRLFHTELETVYEEFNRNQDDDIRWSNFAIDSLLMPNHPYGTQTTIGLGEHLKNPSMVNIHRYFDQYYVPNNVAVILVGDVEETKALETIKREFGSWKSHPVTPFVMQPPVPVTAVKSKEIFGPTKEHVYIGYRFAGAGTREAMMAKLVDMILSNGAAGLIDRNITQQQKALSAASYVHDLRDYTLCKLYGEPKAGQTLEQVRDLLLEQIDAIKKGAFDADVIPAVITNLRLQKMQSRESNRAVANEIMDAFTKDEDWKAYSSTLEAMAKVSKEEIVQFANEHFRDNYAVCFKRLGNPNRHKVDKPKITPVVLNKDSVSSFKRSFDAMPTPGTAPKFIDFDKDVEALRLPNGTQVHAVKNPVNRLFALTYSFHTGAEVDKELGVAADYATLLGTTGKSLSALKMDFFRLGLSYGISVERDRIKVSLRGLEENMDAGVQLLHQVMYELKSDQAVYNNYIADVTKKRANAKLNKGIILQRALVSYAKYGSRNPFTNIMSENELRAADPEKLIQKLKAALTTPDEIFFYSTNGAAHVKKGIASICTKPVSTATQPLAFKEAPIDKSTVYFCQYDMKQAEVVLLTREETFNPAIIPFASLYNEYYGGGLSSILFQEVREKMGLAYAVNSSFQNPPTAAESHYLFTYVGTQADKLKTTMTQLSQLQTTMVEVQKQFDGCRQAIMKNIESDWQYGEGILSAYERAMRRGLNIDLRRSIYDKMKTASINELKQFFQTHVSGKPAACLVIGKRENIDFEALKQWGEIKELTLEQLFGY